MSNKIGDISKNAKEILIDPYKFANNISIDELVETLKQLSYYYYQTDEPLIPDSTYDLLRDVLEERDPDNEYLKAVGAPIDKNKVELPYPMASLNKIKPTTDALTNWKMNYKGPYVLSDKLDGVSGLLYKKDNKFKLYTRGDATTGQDITHLIPYLLKDKYKPGKIPNGTAIRGEIVMSKKNFDTIKDKYKNARNTVAGLVNSKNYSIDIAKLTDFVAYAIIHPKLKQEEQMQKLTEWEFPIVEYKVLKDITNDILSKYLLERRTDSKYDVDGIVVIDSSTTYDVKDLNPEYGFAFKMVLTDQVAEATVLDIEWNITKLGFLKPVVIIKPVNLTGVTIKNITAFNAKYVVNNKLGSGSVIKIVRSGDVIPYILEVLKSSSSGEPKMPTIAYKWNDSNVDIIVKDVHGAAQDAIIIKQITDFFKVIGAKNISEGIVTKLVQHGYKSIQSILGANVDDLKDIEGLGEKSITKIFLNIVESMNEVDLPTLMAASNTFGRLLGVKKLSLITNAYPNIINEKWT